MHGMADVWYTTRPEAKIDDDLLSDIEHLSLDKTQKYNFKDIPDLDDVDLPEIKKSDEPEDIWKF